MDHWVMDYETLSNCFTAVFEHYKTNETKVFVVHKLRNDFDSFIDFLKQNTENREWHISYNGLAFDAQITHFIIDKHESLSLNSAEEIASTIYKYAQQCINKSDVGQFQEYPEWKMCIGQIDLFKMHHWDNAAKRSSLKWIQYSMDWENMLDMPIHHSTSIETLEQIDTILEYNLNDVRSTKEIYKRSTSLIALRKSLSKEYGINLFSASEPRISKELFSYYLSRSLNIPKKDIKNMRTYRQSIKVGDIILPYIKFQSPELQNLLTRFKSLTLNPDNLKGSFKHSVNYRGVKTHFGLGGIHGANKSGVYKSDDKYMIMSSDVTSFYPNLVIRNKWAPGHFPHDEFCNQYEWFFEERKKIPKSNPMNYVYKIILNSTFGLSNDVNSFFYDPELCMRITVNGQLTLMMLYEMIMEEIPDCVALMQNTDGIETLIPREYEDKYMELCKRWEEITNLNLEHDTYQKVVLGDVNNYIGINDYKSVDMNTWREIKKKNPHYLFKVDGDKFYFAPIKMKGRFDFHELALHKNKSKLVVPKAIFQYFVHDVMPMDYLDENHNILDYCIGAKSKGEWRQFARGIKEGQLEVQPLQKVNRYYISNRGVKIVKIHSTDDREIQLESGRWVQTVFNELDIKPKWESYDINKSYYHEAIEQEIDNIMNVNRNQLTLF